VDGYCPKSYGLLCVLRGKIFFRINEVVNEVRLRPKKILIGVSAVVALYAAYIGVSLLFLPSVSEMVNRKASITIQVKDWKGKYHPFIVGPKNRSWTPSGSIPPEMKWAVILAEDSRFYKHEGIDVKAIKNAIKYDLEKKSFARGASTITQQVAKNLYLSREKSISRKIKEVILAKRMEQEMTKGRIIELYLNVVELGPMVYGIGEGARYYFGKPAAALSPRECAFLAAMLPGPRMAYNPYRNLAKVLKRSEMILRLLRGRGVLSEDEFLLAMAESPNISGLQKKVDTSIVKEELPANMSTARLPEPPAAVKDEPAAPPTDAAPAEPQTGTPPAGKGNENQEEKPGEGSKP
jgi:monofunctional glycosyltransferase